MSKIRVFKKQEKRNLGFQDFNTFEEARKSIYNDIEQTYCKFMRQVGLVDYKTEELDNIINVCFMPALMFYKNTNITYKIVEL